MLKAILPSSEVCAFVEVAQKALGETVGTIAHSLNGIVRVMAFEPMATAPTEAVQRLLSHAVQVGGNLVVEKAPTEWKQSLPVWGQPPSSWHLMQRLKATLDPQGILSPGRLF
jgi:glycolate oxidase FAD binding subunit